MNVYVVAEGDEEKTISLVVYMQMHINLHHPHGDLRKVFD